MENTYWFKQSTSEPLFEDVLWSKPENKARAGKLLIIGGHSHSFAVPATAYAKAIVSGIGMVRVLLPDVLRKIVGAGFSEAEFVPSTPNGSLSSRALAELVEAASWADGVLLAGDFGRNSETAVLLERFLEEYKGKITLAHDGLDYFLSTRSPLLARPNTTVVINFGKLQKLAKNNYPSANLQHSMSLQQLVQALHDLTSQNRPQIITKHQQYFTVASKGNVSTTPKTQESNWQVELPAYVSSWWLQQPSKSFESITAAVFAYLAS